MRGNRILGDQGVAILSGDRGDLQLDVFRAAWRCGLLTTGLTGRLRRPLGLIGHGLLLARIVLRAFHRTLAAGVAAAATGLRLAAVTGRSGIGPGLLFVAALLLGLLLATGIGSGGVLRASAFSPLLLALAAATLAIATLAAAAIATVAALGALAIATLTTFAAPLARFRLGLGGCRGGSTEPAKDAGEHAATGGRRRSGSAWCGAARRGRRHGSSLG